MRSAGFVPPASHEVSGHAPAVNTAMLTFASLYLEEPYRDVDGDAQWPAGALKRVGGELGEGYAAAGPDLVVYAVTVSRCCRSDHGHTHPLIPIARPWHTGALVFRGRVAGHGSRVTGCCGDGAPRDCCHGDGRDGRDTQDASLEAQSRLHPLPTHGAFLAHGSMAPRYVVSSDCEHDAESSPDPLAASSDGGRPRARPKQQQQQQPLAASPSKQNRMHPSSPAKQNRLLPSSPAKQMLLSTPRTAGHSPWRIKVTVQAEPGSDTDSDTVESPIVTHVTHTKTTTIPLKDPDASSPVKRRGRPRKADAPPKRSGTPVRKRAAPKPRRPSAGDTSAADVDTDGTPKKKRGRPRKVQPPAEDDIWGQAETDPTPKKRRGRPRKSTQPPAQEAPVLPTEQHAPHSSHIANEVDAISPIPNEVDAISHIPNEVLDISSDEETEEERDIHSEFPLSEGHPQPQAEEAPHHLSELEPLSARATRTPGTEDGQLEDETQFAFDEGATRMPDDTTIIDSENFSMISVDSLPSCASVTRPVHGMTGDTSSSSRHKPPQNQIYLQAPSGDLHRGASSIAGARTSHALPGGPTAAPLRYKTPSVEPVDLTNPPPVAAARMSPTEAQTPIIGRVVKAGVALQGVLDPNRVTPEAGPSRTVDERRDHLDDLFRGFSERTRRELHAGLRLGEQLAKQNGSDQPSSPALSSPIENATSTLPAISRITTNAIPQSSRLLTPEDQDADTALEKQPTEVQHPVLQNDTQGSGLLSPVSNPEEDEDDTSWRIEAPPVHPSNQAGTPLLATVRQPSGAARRDVSDMWAQKASRSPLECENENICSDSAQQHQDPFIQTGIVKPGRGEVPRMRQRKSLDNSPYSDEAEEEDARIVAPSPTESESPARAVDIGKAKVVQASAPAKLQCDDCDEETEATDNTGMFFQATLPNPVNRKRCNESRRKRAPQQDIFLNLDESLLPESSPPTAAKTSATDKRNPFMDTPPRLAALRSSHVKSSPLRQELRSPDISSDSTQQTFEESTLPMAPSSPFHTYVEGDTGFSIASDQRQLIHEMARTDSSLRRIRVEADKYLDAYEPQERSLHDLTEVTEPSRTWNKDSTLLTSRPPDKAKTLVASQIEKKDSTQQHNDVSDIQTPTRSPATRTRFPPPAHPTLLKLDPLPAVEPWTKTHYEALDRLYQLYKKQPSIFSTTEAPNAALNVTLLTNFMNTTTRNFIGARYRAWGYNVIFTDALVVLCAAFMQLLALNSVEKYEATARKRIQVGECQPGLSGNLIGVEAVVERLATVVLGEAVRRDEKRGRVVDKSGRLRVEWP